MALFGTTQLDFSDPTEFWRYELDPSSTGVMDGTAAQVLLNTTTAFTGLNTQGLADTTNWATDTYKSLLSTSEAGEMLGYIGPQMATAGDIHTVEFTVDGVVTTIATAIENNNKRVALYAGGVSRQASADDFTAVRSAFSSGGSLSTNKRFTITSTSTLPSMRMATVFGVPLLTWKYSLLIRAKNSAAITNSTATAYSAITYRLKGTS